MGDSPHDCELCPFSNAQSRFVCEYAGSGGEKCADEMGRWPRESKYPAGAGKSEGRTLLDRAADMQFNFPDYDRGLGYFLRK
jgi:hypothetical protein